MAKTPRWPARAVLIPLAALLYPLLAPGSLGAMPPPTKEQWEQYRQDGSLKARIAQARELGNHRADPELVRNAEARLRTLAAAKGVAVPERGDALRTPPAAWSGMPTKGTVKMLVLCIDFSDYPHDDTNNSVAKVKARVLGSGDTLGLPYESLKNYYQRASYDQLTLTGEVLGWYRAGARSAVAKTTAGRQALIKEALAYYNGGAGGDHDFSQYDNNGDGKIDYFAVIWSGPSGGWSDFWWGYQTSWSGTDTFDGKRLGKYSWQWESKQGYSRSYPLFDPLVLIHETGHALGLPDYYDYDEAQGPSGGVGGLDMMDGNMGDHNCFSKFLLDWITPAVYTSSASGLGLLSSGDHRDGNSIIVMDANPGGCFGEYFMVQNRQRVGNDLNAGYPSDGLLVWHVDARLDDTGRDYAYDNSYTAHKLLRLMEADGLEEIETGANADAGDYYTQGRSFGPATSPNSSSYDGIVTCMALQNISAPGATVTLDVVKVEDSSAPTGVPGKPTGSSTGDSVTFTWTVGTAADPDLGIAGYHLQVGSIPGGSNIFDGGVGNVTSRVLTDMGLLDGLPVYARVAAMNGVGTRTGWSASSDAVTPALPVLDGAVLDAPALAFKTVGPWAADSAVFQAGGSAAKSPTLGDASRAYLQTRVQGPGTFSFYWKVSSESGYDFLTLSVDGVDQDRISGEVDWTQKSLTLEDGSHLVRWTYAKDANSAGGSDAAWVDHVEAPVAMVAPAITSFSPASAYAGATVTITGSGFAGATKVTFNGLDAPSFSVTGATQITAVVPAGSASGPIAVTTPGGTATSSAAFTSLGVPPAPVVTAFSPAAACVGTTVTVEGSGLDTATSVTFGGISATFTVQSATRLSAVVPAGAASGTLRVATAGGSAEAPTPFTLRGFDLNAVSGVDLADLARIARSFGKRSGDAGFDAACDLNGDGVVDEKDATLLFAHLD